MLTTILDVVHVFVCGVLMFVVLLQQGRGGGLGSAFGGGGGGASQVFGGRGAGNILTRATAICAATFMLTSVSLAYLSSSGDRALKARAAMEERKQAEKGTLRAKEPKAEAPATPSTAPAEPAAPAAPSPPAPAPSH